MEATTVDLKAIERGEYVRGLRELADLLENHAELPLPGKSLTAYALGEPEEERAALRAMARILPRVDKEYTGSARSLLTVSTRLGGIEYAAVAYRENVCTRRQVGTKKVEREVPVETRTEVEEVPVYEWDCEPLLG